MTATATAADATAVDANTVISALVAEVGRLTLRAVAAETALAALRAPQETGDQADA